MQEDQKDNGFDLDSQSNTDQGTKKFQVNFGEDFDENNSSNLNSAPLNQPRKNIPISLTDKNPIGKPDFKVEFDEDVNQIKDFVPRKPKRKKYFSGVGKLFNVLLVIGIAGVLAFGILFSIAEVMGQNRSGDDVILEVKKGDTVLDIALKLKEKDIIQSEMLFRTYIKVLRMDPKLKEGVHKLNPSMAYGDIIYELEQHTKSNESVKVTFPEGFTLIKIAKRLEASGVCDSDDFLDAFNDTDYGYDFEKTISDDPLKYFKKEGFAFPDTYTFSKDDNPYNVASKIANNFERKITPEMYARMNKLKLSLEETIIIASIVQSEAPNLEEMKKVASVYFNRLNNKGVYPLLQADPTKKYGRELKSFMDVANQEILDAYNTYDTKGLPPGAIANPGMDAINATLYPAKTDYFYFCSNLKTRQFYYAVTLKEHEANLYRAGLV